jgi:hypothetical protein
MNITGSSSLGLHEISEAASVIYEKADEDANIILGSVIDDSLEDEVTVTVIATGFNEKSCAVPVDVPTKVEVPKVIPVVQKVEQPLVELSSVEVPQVAAYQVVAPKVEQPVFQPEPVRVEAAAPKVETVYEPIAESVQAFEPVQEREIHFSPVEHVAKVEHSAHQPIVPAPEEQREEIKVESREIEKLAEVKDLDVPTFMRKEKRNKNKHHKGHKGHQKGHY